MTSNPFPEFLHTLLIMAGGVLDEAPLAAIFSALDGYQISLLDQSQLLIRDRLISSILIKVDPAHVKSIKADLASLATNENLDLAVEDAEVEGSLVQLRTRVDGEKFVLRIVGQRLDASQMAAIFSAIEQSHSQILNLRRLSISDLVAFEYLINVPSESAGQLADLFSAIAESSQLAGLDLLFMAQSDINHGKLAVLLDMDSTFIRQEVIDELAAMADKREEVAAITEKAMRGELDFQAALLQRCALLSGLPEVIFDQVQERIELSPGALTLVRTLKKFGHSVGVVSGGFTNVGKTVIHSLGLDFFEANTLEVKDGFLTGAITGQIVDRDYKTAALARFGAEAKADYFVAIGDGANDLGMIAAADLGIAYCAKPVTKAGAKVSINSANLERVLYLLGFTSEEIAL